MAQPKAPQRSGSAKLARLGPYVGTHRSSTSAAWWRGAVIYHCHLPSFRDANDDGIGDLVGLRTRLPYLANLGIDAIWTGPFYVSPLLDNGYDVADHRDVDPRFGSLQDFDDLVDAAHAAGIKVIVDFIPNHTSDQHPWFVESRSSRTSQKRDWYIWRDAAPDGGLPNNWTSEAGGSVWEWDPSTSQYYLHSHLRQQPDLNWRCEAVRDAMSDVLTFWLRRGADGVRIDVAHMLMKDPELRDNPVADFGNHNVLDLQHHDFGSQLHIHDRRHPDTHVVLEEMRAVADAFENRVLIAEVEAMDWADWSLYYGKDLRGMHLPFPFRLLETAWDAESLASELKGMYNAIPPGGWPILALGNHDRSRLASRLGPDQALVAAVLLLTLAVTPCLYYGDELGMRDQHVPPHLQRDHFGLSEGGVSRDICRAPMPWNGGLNAGFSNAAPSQLWLPVARNADELSVEAQLADPQSQLSMFRRLIELRRTYSSLATGALELLTGLDVALLAYERVSGRERLRVLLNMTDRAITAPADGEVLFSTDTDRAASSFDGALQPNEGLVLLIASKTGVAE